MICIQTSVKFESAHRQLGDKSKCGKLHGHNWKVDFELNGTPNDIGYVVDFKLFKEIIQELDHKVILSKYDPLIKVLKRVNQEVYIMNRNPTCENIAEYLLDLCSTAFDINDVKWSKLTIKVYENDVSFATAVGWSEK